MTFRLGGGGKVYQFANDALLFIEIPKESSKRLLELIN